MSKCGCALVLCVVFSVLSLHTCFGELPEEHLRIAADVMTEVKGLAESAATVQDPAQAEEEFAACMCAQRAKDGRPCSEGSVSNKLSEDAAKGCTLELQGMPANEFKKQVHRDCVCRVQTSAGFPCVDAAEEARRNEIDAEFKKVCTEQHEEAQKAPRQRAKEAQECVCAWAKDVLPTLCNSQENQATLRAKIDDVASACAEASEKTTEAEATCVCDARNDAKIPCLGSAEWKKMQAAVAAQYATCVKVNRRRRVGHKSDAVEEAAASTPEASATPEGEAEAAEEAEAADEAEEAEEAAQNEAEASEEAEAAEEAEASDATESEAEESEEAVPEASASAEVDPSKAEL